MPLSRIQEYSCCCIRLLLHCDREKLGDTAQHHEDTRCQVDNTAERQGLVHAIALGECCWRNESRGTRYTDNTSEKSMMGKGF